MSSIAVPAPLHRAYRFYQTTLGKKAIMAVTGVIMFGFVIGHLAGNLQAFQGREPFDAYGVFLRTLPIPLYTFRLVLLVSVTLHILSTVQLALLKQRARPVNYVKKNNRDSSYAARTMYWSGPIVGMFIVYHLLHFTFLAMDTRFREGHIYDNLVIGFSYWPVSLVYVVSLILLGMHLNHGLYSMFQTLGGTTPAYTLWIKRFAWAMSAVITLGFISIPIAVLAGVIHL